MCTFDNKLIILMGFMQVGKTLIGRSLANMLHVKFIELDRKIEQLYEKYNFTFLTCREIMLLHGESYYRELETAALQKSLERQSGILALGGGTLLNPFNQEAIKPYPLLHIIASPGIVFERIMVKGRPAFFDPFEDPYESFSRLWEERNAIFKKLTENTVNNNGTIIQAVRQVISHLTLDKIQSYETRTYELHAY
jgi:shikimate kinase